MRLESSLKLKCERAFMVGVEIHLPNMASSQIIKPPAFKSPSRAPGNNCSARLGGGGGGQIWQLRFQESSSVWAGCIPVYGSRPQRVSYLAQLFNKQKRCMWKVVGTGRLFLPTIILRLTLGGGSRLRTSRGCYIKPFRNLAQAFYSIASGDSLNWVHAIHNWQMFLFTAWFQIISVVTESTHYH